MHPRVRRRLLLVSFVSAPSHELVSFAYLRASKIASVTEQRDSFRILARSRKNKRLHIRIGARPMKSDSSFCLPSGRSFSFSSTDL